MNEVGSREAEVAARLRARYPRSRVPRPVAVIAVVVLAVVGLGWLTWAGYMHATPQVDSQVESYVVRSDEQVSVRLTVERRDPSLPATCRVVAQATDFETVGELEVPVPPGASRQTGIDVQLVTLRRATTAVAKGCTSGG